MRLKGQASLSEIPQVLNGRAKISSRALGQSDLSFRGKGAHDICSKAYLIQDQLQQVATIRYTFKLIISTSLVK